MAAIGTRYYTPAPFEINQDGVPQAGSQLFFYETGTTTPQNTYSDVNLTTPNANPVIADANGRWGDIWLIPSSAYAVEFWTAPTPDNPTGVEVWAHDPVGPASGGVPSNVAGIVGEIRAFAGLVTAIPAQWYLCYGQAVSRTTYATAFAVMGTMWGAGDLSTTFNLPDLRGRALFGQDNMGGTPATRLTAGVSGVPGTTIGGVGGDQHVGVSTLSSTATSTSVVTDPMHAHYQITTGRGGGAGNPADGGGGTVLYNYETEVAATNITVATTTTVTPTSDATGVGANVPPAAVVQWIIYLGA